MRPCPSARAPREAPAPKETVAGDWAAQGGASAALRHVPRRSGGGTGRPAPASADPLALAVGAVGVAAELRVRPAVRGLRIRDQHVAVVGVARRRSARLVPPETTALLAEPVVVHESRAGRD